MSPLLAELLGTMLLIVMGGGVVANVCLSKTKGNGSGWIVIATAWAMAVYVGVVVAAPYSGAHLNPAVSIGLAIAGKFAWSQVLPYIIAQMIGAFSGSFLVWIAYKKHFDATDDKGAILAVFCTNAEIKSPAYNFLTEVIGTFVLMFVVFYISGGELCAGGANENIPVGLGSVGGIPVAFTVWAIGLSLGGPTGYAINPARDIAPRLMHNLLPIKAKGSSQWSYAWVPGFAPIVGASIAALLYLCLQNTL